MGGMDEKDSFRSSLSEGSSISHNGGEVGGGDAIGSSERGTAGGRSEEIRNLEKRGLQTGGEGSGSLGGSGASKGLSEGNGHSDGSPSVHGPEMVSGRGAEDSRKKMKTLVVANQKGGVGKTATLVHLAWYAAQQGAKVVVVDLDTQGNASFTLSAHDTAIGSSELLRGKTVPNIALVEAGIKLIHADPQLADTDKMTLAEAGTNFRSSLKALEQQGFDLCLIDTAPSLGVTMAAALLGGGYVLSPIELEAYSIQGIRKMLLTVNNLKRANPELSFLGMAPSKVDGRNPRHRQHLAELSKAYPEAILPAHVGLRSSVADALASKRPVWTIKKTAARKAAQEIQNLGAFVFQKMGVSF